MRRADSRGYPTPSRAASLKRATSVGPPPRQHSYLWLVVAACLLAFGFVAWRFTPPRGHTPVANPKVPEQGHRRSLGGSQRALRLEQEVARLAKALNLTQEQLQVAQRHHQQSEADHQSTRREYDKLLGELTSLGHTKLEEDKQTLVGVEELTNQLQNAEERMAVAEFRTKQAAEVIASCERRVQGSGDEQDSRLLQLAVKLLLAPPATPHNLTDANGSVVAAALDHRAGVGAAEALQMADSQTQQDGSQGAARRLAAMHLDQHAVLDILA